MPSGDGLPEGADILVTKKKVRGDTADNLYLEVKQPQTATKYAHCFCLEP